MPSGKNTFQLPRSIPHTGKMIWDEARIRAEIARLDKKTGLSGASLPITFSNARRTLGMFCYPVKEDAALMYFRFSHHWFQNPDFSEEMALDTIRHEYAHYMNHVRHKGHGHDRSWKQCCRMVGARPERLYSEADNERFKQLHHEEEEKTAARRLSSEKFCAGRVIRHPRLGMGCIRALSGSGQNMKLSVEFSNTGTRCLSLDWVAANCQLVA